MEKITVCINCGTTTDESTCPSCGKAVRPALAADPFGSDALTPAIPPAPPTQQPRSGEPAENLRGPVTGRPAGADLLPGVGRLPIRELVGGVVLLAFLGVIVIGFFPRIFGGFSSSPEINDFEVGTCFVTEGPGDFTEAPCGDLHDGEVVGSQDWIGTDVYPGSVELEDWANTHCTAQFLSYVGVGINKSALNLGVLFPSATSWSDGDRRAICAVQFPTTPETESIRESGR